MTTVPNIRTICLLVNLISATVHIAEPVLVRGVVRHVHDFTKKQFFVKKNRNIICMELFKMWLKTLTTKNCGVGSYFINKWGHWILKIATLGFFWWKGGGSHYPNPQKIKFRRRRRRMIMILFTCPWWRQQAQCQELPDGGNFFVAFLTIMLNIQWTYTTLPPTQWAEWVEPACFVTLALIVRFLRTVLTN